MLLRFGGTALCLTLLLSLAVIAPAQTTASITILGEEKYLSGTGMWDSGIATLTVNGHSESVRYGQFSTAASIASGLAAKFSSDCAGPANAKATGATIAIKLRTGKGTSISSMSFMTVPDDPANFPQSSFWSSLTWPPANPTPVDLTCSPNPTEYGTGVTCVAVVPLGAVGTVGFLVDSADAGVALPVADGVARYQILAASLGLGIHTVQATYSGGTYYNSGSSLPVDVVVTAPLNCSE